MKYLLLFFTTCSLICMLWACKDSEEITPGESLTELAQVSFNKLDIKSSISIESNSLIVGYNSLQVSLTKKGSQTPYMDAEVSLNPMMEMPNMMHSTPTRTPEASTGSPSSFSREVFFIMPSGEMGSWTLEVKIKDLASGLEEMVAVPIEVEAPEEAKMKSFLSEIDSSGIFISLVQPQSPVVGLNEFQVALHQRENMMSFPPLQDLTVEIEPEMPTMGHGSEGNVDPTHSYEGLYQGNVYFNMEGFWRVHVRMKDTEGRSVGETYFDLTF